MNTPRRRFAALAALSLGLTALPLAVLARRRAKY